MKEPFAKPLNALKQFSIFECKEVPLLTFHMILNTLESIMILLQTWTINSLKIAQHMGHYFVFGYLQTSSPQANRTGVLYCTPKYGKKQYLTELTYFNFKFEVGRYLAFTVILA